MSMPPADLFISIQQQSFPFFFHKINFFTLKPILLSTTTKRQFHICPREFDSDIWQG